MAKGPLTGKAVMAGTGQRTGEGKAQAEGAPGGRAVSDGRLLALEGSKKRLLEASALGEAQTGGDA